MGSGKSSVGRKLVEKLQESYFLDTDFLIESYENRSVSDIFEKEGEKSFREKEGHLFNWIKKSVKNGIISTGGGLPIFVPEIRDAGIVIYLEVEFQEIVKRLSKSELSQRPLFQDIKKAETLYKERDEVYKKLAHYTIKNDNLENSVNKIVEIWKTEWK